MIQFVCFLANIWYKITVFYFSHFIRIQCYLVVLSFPVKFNAFSCAYLPSLCLCFPFKNFLKITFLVMLMQVSGRGGKKNRENWSVLGFSFGVCHSNCFCVFRLGLLCQKLFCITSYLRSFLMFWFHVSFDLGVTKTNKETQTNPSPNNKTAVNTY